jgi:hypothetical protein
MAGEYKLVDPFFNMPRPPGPNPNADPNIMRWFKDSKAMVNGATHEEMLADMDEAGIEFGMVTIQGGTQKTGYYAVGQEVSDESLDAAMQRYAELKAKAPKRIFGCVWIDPTGMMKAVRQLERAVKEYGFQACHLMPSVTGLPSNHAVYFPIYAKCVELGIPVKINVGVPGPLRPADPQRPIYLDEVLIAFPELTVVGTHVGHPWHLETVALLQKHANFYLITSGFAPKHVPQEIWDVANRRVPHKLMWSSDYPILPMQRCAKEGWEAPLKDEVKRKYLRENAMEVFKIGV